MPIPLSPLFVGVGFLTTFGSLTILFRLLTFGQRRIIREIRNGANQHGFAFRRPDRFRSPAA